jgi:hypothetical protein
MPAKTEKNRRVDPELGADAYENGDDGQRDAVFHQIGRQGRDMDNLRRSLRVQRETSPGRNPPHDVRLGLRFSRELRDKTHVRQDAPL